MSEPSFQDDVINELGDDRLTEIAGLLGTDANGIEVGWFFLAVGLRDAAVVVLVALVVRDVLQPDRDVVRAGWRGVDDPAGGVLDHAPDALRASPRPRAVPRGR